MLIILLSIPCVLGFNPVSYTHLGIVFLASPLASGINGVVLFVDGGIDALLRSEQF